MYIYRNFKHKEDDEYDVNDLNRYINQVAGDRFSWTFDLSCELRHIVTKFENDRCDFYNAISEVDDVVAKENRDNKKQNVEDEYDFWGNKKQKEQYDGWGNRKQKEQYDGWGNKK